MPRTSAVAIQLAEKLHSAPPDPGLAIIFPGQGSHQVGAGRDLYERFAPSREVFERCEEAVGRPLAKLCFEGPETELRDTANAQPAIFAVSLACLAAALEIDAIRRRPAFLAGHSLGEFTALVAAGALTIEDAARLVARRGSLMSQASRLNPGTMAALVGLDDKTAAEVCHRSGVEPCNYNLPSQVVVGGTSDAVESATRLAKQLGGRALPLSVSGAFHTSLMGPAAEEFATAVDSCPINDPAIPVVANSTAESLTTVTEVRQELRQQIVRPVLWHQSILEMTSAGVNRFIEAGPGRVLSGMIRRAGDGLTALTLDSAESLEALPDV